MKGFLCAAVLCLSASHTMAQGVEDFYRGRTMTLIVSSEAGGGYDATARITARHLPKYMPGAPHVVVQNMPGAGGIRAPNFVYNVSEKDGTVFALMQNTIPFEPMIGNKAATFDPLKLLWLGSPNYETGVLVVWRAARARTLADLRNIEITAGVPAIASTPAFNTRLLNKALGLKLKVIPGYPGSTAALLAMEKGEVDAFANFHNSQVQSRPTWVKEGKADVLVQWGPHREPALKDVPYLPDLVKDPDQKALVQAASASLALGRPFMMPPGVPQARFEAARKALFATFNDPAFAAEAHKIGFTDLAPQTGEQIEKVVREAYAAPPHIIAQLRAIATGEGM